MSRLGSEWAGVTPVVVLHDANAPEGNFDAPSVGTKGTGYSVHLRSDASFLYGLVLANGNTSNMNFANLYFDTDFFDGSDFGIELGNGNNRAFTPGVNVGTYYSLATYLTVAEAGGDTAHGIEFALSWDYFQQDPSGILPVDSGDNGVQLRISQSYGYSAAGGDLANGTRFGTVARAENAVPEPSSLALGGSRCWLLAPLAVVARTDACAGLGLQTFAAHVLRPMRWQRRVGRVHSCVLSFPQFPACRGRSGETA